MRVGHAEWTKKIVPPFCYYFPILGIDRGFYANRKVSSVTASFLILPMWGAQTSRSISAILKAATKRRLEYPSG